MTKQEEALYKATQTIKFLGGSRRLQAGIGAKHFVWADEGRTVTFKFMKNKSGANYVRLDLNAMDLYDVTFTRVHGTKLTVKHRESGLYADMLLNHFEEVTGLNLSIFAGQL